MTCDLLVRRAASVTVGSLMNRFKAKHYPLVIINTKGKIEPQPLLANMHPFLTGPLLIERVTIPIRDLSPQLHGTTLVQLSDFHFDGVSLSVDLLSEAIARCNAAAPDLIVLTGDFITKSSRDIHTLTPFLRNLKSRLGTYAVLGNHDSPNRTTRLMVREALENAKITVLWNEIAYPWGQNLPLIGLADLKSKKCDPAPLLKQLDTTTPRIVLAHNPDTADMLKPWRVDLQLSGHTHGGQIAFPGIGSLPEMMSRTMPFLPQWMKKQVPYFSKKRDRIFKHWEWSAGLHRVGQSYLYVNRGLGTYFPGRLFCPPELTVFSLLRH